MIDKLNIGQKFIITYRPNTHNGVARPKLKNGKDTRQITRRAQWTDKSKVVKDQELNYKFREQGSRYADRLELSDCEDQLREWASTLAEREIERRPEGAKLKQLKDLKTKALDVVMESGTPDSLAIALDQVSKKIGLRWNQDLQALPNFKQ